MRTKLQRNCWHRNWETMEQQQTEKMRGNQTKKKTHELKQQQQTEYIKW